jgi:Fe-S-cluster containining protein
MKKAVLNSLYKCFYQWSKMEEFCCAAGCAACCSQNVTLTAQEGARILDFLRKEGQDHLVYEKIKALPSWPKPKQTTNEYVLTSLQNQETEQDSVRRQGPCPFLSKNHCTIYPVRPFSCRCFASETKCMTDIAAAVPEHYLYGSIVVMQLIEHLDQFHHWGYMTDMLLYLYGSNIDKETTKNLLISKPLPGFFLTEQHNDRVQLLIDSIFTTQIGTKTIEQILNGQ